MKRIEGMHFLFGIFVCVLVLPLSWSYVTGRRTAEEQERIIVAEDILTRKLEMYEMANGHYPESVAALSFTNSDIERESLPSIDQIKYERTPNGYTLRYRDFFGYHSLVVCKGR